jgi:hypothetical protein
MITARLGPTVASPCTAAMLPQHSLLPQASLQVRVTRWAQLSPLPPPSFPQQCAENIITILAQGAGGTMTQTPERSVRGHFVLQVDR